MATGVNLKGVTQGKMTRFWLKDTIAKGWSYIDEFLFTSRETSSIYKHGLIKYVSQARVKIHKTREIKGKYRYWFVHLAYDINMNSTRKSSGSKEWQFKTNAQATKKVSQLKRLLKGTRTFTGLAQRLIILKGR